MKGKLGVGTWRPGTNRTNRSWKQVVKAVWRHGLTVGCLVGAVATSFARPLQNNAVITDPAWVLHVDVDALRDTKIGKEILRELDRPDLQAKFALYKLLLSFAPREALHGVTPSLILNDWFPKPAATVGDPTKLDAAAWKPGTYRDPGNNHRHCSGISYTGPWGDPDWNPEGKGWTGDVKGRFTSGNLWLRMYGLDRAHPSQGGVSFPKVTYQLPDGRKYFITVDFTKSQAGFDRTRALVRQTPAEMNNPGVGWNKMMSIFRAICTGFARGHDPDGWLFSNSPSLHHCWNHSAPNELQFGWEK